MTRPRDQVDESVGIRQEAVRSEKVTFSSTFRIFRMSVALATTRTAHICPRSLSDNVVLSFAPLCICHLTCPCIGSVRELVPCVTSMALLTWALVHAEVPPQPPNPKAPPPVTTSTHLSLFFRAFQSIIVIRSISWPGRLIDEHYRYSGQVGPYAPALQHLR